MPDILVRGLDARVIARLKKQAKANGRSLQAEAKGILENAAKLDAESVMKRIHEIRRRLAGQKFPDSTQLLREDRER